MSPAARPGARLGGPAAAGAVALVFVDDLDDPVPRPDDAHHLFRVLRLRPGELVVAADGSGGWRTTAVRADGRALEVRGPQVAEAAPASPVAVGFVPVKGERPESVVHKLTEAGVDRIVVMRSARSVVRWDAERAEPALERLRRVAREAAAQCRRARLPEVSGILDPGQLAAELAAGPGPSVLHLAEPGADPPGPGVTAVAVGPEGGWDPAELALAPGRVGLGTTILRAETAAVGAGVLLCALRDGVVGSAPA
ncbi:MAG TPA: RsmE family RNA methyltransferase [Acidimicrobiales bacterium]|nr:RsmE family RNA methyltransferase [Acidimicrobiales bacterium]